MGLWIRSQNKEILTECLNVEVEMLDTNYFIKDNFVRVGQYSSKEKALKVMDMMQKHIEDGAVRLSNILHLPYDLKAISKDYDIREKVFQMPQDDEVIV